MNKWIKYSCVLLVLFFGITTIVIVRRKQQEKYKLLRDVGKFPFVIGNRKMLRKNSSSGSIKFRGHRYDRHKTRNNFLNQKNYY